MQLERRMERQWLRDLSALSYPVEQELEAWEEFAEKRQRLIDRLLDCKMVSIERMEDEDNKVVEALSLQCREVMQGLASLEVKKKLISEELNRIGLSRRKMTSSVFRQARYRGRLHVQA